MEIQEEVMEYQTFAAYIYVTDTEAQAVERKRAEQVR